MRAFCLQGIALDRIEFGQHSAGVGDNPLTALCQRNAVRQADEQRRIQGVL
ncbi:hypothetical protein D3C80_1866910 [compost metagenome]